MKWGQSEVSCIKPEVHDMNFRFQNELSLGIFLEKSLPKSGCMKTAPQNAKINIELTNQKLVFHL